MYAIITKYYGPTNYKGSRIRAKAAERWTTHDYDHRLTAEANHDEAARKLAKVLGWEGQWARGEMPSGDGNVYVRCLGGPLSIG